MENKILMSIATKQTNKIFNGTKKWEFRKLIPKEIYPTESKIIVYSSKIDKAIVGEFTVGRILQCNLEKLLVETGYNNDSEAYEWFSNYYKGKEICCALEVTNPRLYKRSIKLEELKSELTKFTPPQNYLYILDNSELNQLVKKRTLK